MCLGSCIVASALRHSSKAPGPAVRDAIPRQTRMLIKSTWPQSVPRRSLLWTPTLACVMGFFEDPPQPAQSRQGTCLSRWGNMLTGRGWQARERSPWKPAGARALCAEPRGCGSAELRVSGPRPPPTRKWWRPDPGASFPTGQSLSPDPPRLPSKQEQTGLGVFFPNARGHPSPSLLD